MTCRQCGRELTRDEVGLFKKLVSRGAVEFLCLPCLAAYFRVSEELLLQKIEDFRKMGCTLFR